MAMEWLDTLKSSRTGALPPDAVWYPGNFKVVIYKAFYLDVVQGLWMEHPMRLKLTCEGLLV